MNLDSTHIQAPFFGPRLPDYPALRQIVRVGDTSSSSSGAGNIFPGWIEQSFGDSPGFRDREACIILEPNGLSLRAGSYHKARLIGNLGGLPLLAVSVLCCTPMSFSSVSASSGLSLSSRPSSESSFSQESSSSSSESCCTCHYTLTAVLDWTGNTDLDLYVRNVTEGVVCWFGRLVAGGLTLNHDAHPVCAATPLAPEGISGAFTSSNVFSVYYNQFSACTAESPPTITSLVLTNTGPCPITVNGETIEPGDAYTLDSFAYGGYDTRAIPDFAGGTIIDVECPCQSSSSRSSVRSSSRSSESTVCTCNFDCPVCPDGLVCSWSFNISAPSESSSSPGAIPAIPDKLLGDWTVYYNGGCSYSFQTEDVIWTLEANIAPILGTIDQFAGQWTLTGECVDGIRSWRLLTDSNVQNLCKCNSYTMIPNDPPCTDCPAGTPSSWTWMGAGFSGCFAAFNGSFLAGDPGQCVWIGVNDSDPLNVVESNLIVNSFGSELTLNNINTGAHLTYIALPILPLDCTAPITLTRFFGPEDFCPGGIGVAAPTITITPQAPYLPALGFGPVTLFPSDECPCPSSSSSSPSSESPASSSSVSPASSASPPSSSSSVAGIPTTCCPDVLFPPNLHVTISPPSTMMPGCSCILGSYPLNFDYAYSSIPGNFPTWVAFFTVCGSAQEFYLQCTFEGWTISCSVDGNPCTGGCFFNNGSPVITCSPVNLLFADTPVTANLGAGTCCAEGDSAFANFTITE